MPHPLILLGVGVVAVAAVVGSQIDVSSLMGTDDKVEVARTTTRAAPQRAAADAQTSTAPAIAPGAPGFDVVRIDPNGVAVLAGRATPNSEVVITANGKPLATARSDAGGDWSAVAQHKFDAGRLQLGLAERNGGAAEPVRMAAVDVDVVAGVVATVTAPPRAEAPVRVATAQSPVRQVEQMIEQARVGEARPSIRPVPITFVFREATFTEEGRRAVQLLSQYLELQKPAAITLSGHADERGSDQLNIELSRERLAAVARQLREGGYTGKLDLLPKGKSEPYAGIDRRAVPREQAWQLDRRVELRVQ